MNEEFQQRAEKFWDKVQAGEVDRQKFMDFMEQFYDDANEKGWEAGKDSESGYPY